jgi:hypothetical protein
MNRLSPPALRLRPAVNAFCKACIYDKSAGYGSWRKQVSNCRSFSCPLFNVRPGATKARSTNLTSRQSEKTERSDVFLTDAERSRGQGDG